jgi:hypothetical protein
MTCPFHRRKATGTVGLLLLLLGSVASFSVRPATLRSSVSQYTTTTRLNETPYFPTSNDNNNNSSDNDEKNTVSNDIHRNTSSNRRRKTFWQTVDDVGLDLKPRAERANAKAALAESKARKLRYMAQACALYALFILYRAYRGFFVIIPIVFRETFRKLEAAVDEDPFGDWEEESTTTSASSLNTTSSEDLTFRWRTRITISALATVLTASYVLGGAIRVGTKLVRSLIRGSNLVRSFSDAADTQERNEDRILKRIKKEEKKNNGWKDFAP